MKNTPNQLYLTEKNGITAARLTKKPKRVKQKPINEPGNNLLITSKISLRGNIAGELRSKTGLR